MRSCQKKDNLERAISRRLDGELTEAEALALDKRLIRDPEARALAEAMGGDDALVGAALRDVLSGGPTGRSAELGDRAAWQGRRRWVRWRVPLAVAAGIAVMLGAASVFVVRDASGGPARRSRLVEARVPHGAPGAETPAAAPAVSVVPVARDIASKTGVEPGRQLYGVVGDDGRTVYLLEVGAGRGEGIRGGARF
jgi:anti-sigma factor RsiW